MDYYPPIEGPSEPCDRCGEDSCVCGLPPIHDFSHVAPTFHPNDPKGHAGSLKAPLGLIPTAGLTEAAWVHKLGADKYGIYNWRDAEVLASTYVNATLRHLLAWRDGEDTDPESGRSHLGHIIANAGILLDAMQHGTMRDDRYKKP